MAPHSSTLAWKIPWTGEPGRLRSTGSLESDTTERLHFHFSLSCIGEGGNPLQCSCLENPRDGEAWWAAVYGVAQSWTRLKWLSSSSSNVLTCSTFSVLGRGETSLVWTETNKPWIPVLWEKGEKLQLFLSLHSCLAAPHSFHLFFLSRVAWKTTTL